MTDVVWSGVPDEPGRDMTEILYQEPSYEERAAARREQAARDELAARAQVAADHTEHRSWLARLRGEQTADVSGVLARARQDGPSRGDAERRHAARQVLRHHGLEDVLGGGSMTVLDANMGTLEPAGRLASEQRSELDDPKVRRSLEALRGADAVIARAKARRHAEISRSRQVPARVPSGGHGPGSGCPQCRAVYDASPIPPWARSA